LRLARLSLLVPLFLLASAAAADPVLDSIRAEAARAEASGFERTTREEKQTDAGPEVTVRVDRFNPQAPKDKQWTLLTVNGRPATKAENNEHKRKVSSYPVPGFYMLSAIMAAEPIRTTDAKGRTLYRWEALPAGSLPTAGPDVSPQLAAEATVEKVGGRPMFTKVRIFAPRPFSFMAVARMKEFDLTSVYQPGNGGTHMLVAQISRTDISAPFGKGGKQVSQISFRPI